MTQTNSLILASASPRRRELLGAMGVTFDVMSVDIDESPFAGEKPHDHVARLAQQKAQAARRALVKSQQENVSDNNCISAILAADTIVALDDQIFGKPRDEQHARDMWQQLSNREHKVITSVCLQHSDTLTSDVIISNIQAITAVQFASISEQQMQRYWHSGEPQDKAGAYAIQGLASAWVKQIKGCYSNVVGLPLHEVNQLLMKIGLNWL